MGGYKCLDTRNIPVFKENTSKKVSAENSKKVMLGTGPSRRRRAPRGLVADFAPPKNYEGTRLLFPPPRKNRRGPFSSVRFSVLGKWICFVFRRVIGRPLLNFSKYSTASARINSIVSIIVETATNSATTRLGLAPPQVKSEKIERFSQRISRTALWKSAFSSTFWTKTLPRNSDFALLTKEIHLCSAPGQKQKSY